MLNENDGWPSIVRSSMKIDNHLGGGGSIDNQFEEEELSRLSGGGWGGGVIRQYFRGRGTQ